MTARGENWAGVRGQQTSEFREQGLLGDREGWKGDGIRGRQETTRLRPAEQRGEGSKCRDTQAPLVWEEDPEDEDYSLLRPEPCGWPHAGDQNPPDPTRDQGVHQSHLRALTPHHQSHGGMPGANTISLPEELPATCWLGGRAVHPSTSSALSAPTHRTGPAGAATMSSEQAGRGGHAR